LKRAKKAFLQIHRQEGTVERLTSLGNRGTEEHEELTLDYSIQKNSLRKTGVFRIDSPAAEFRVTIEYDSEAILERCRQRRQEIRDSIIDELEQRVETVPPEHRNAIEAELEQTHPSVERLRTTARQVFLDSTGDVDELEETKAELESRLTDIEAELAVYESLTELLETLPGRRDELTQQREQFWTQFRTYEADIERRVFPSDEYVYEKLVRPDELRETLDCQDISESGILTSESERQRLQRTLEEIAQTLTQQEYTGLWCPEITASDRQYGGLGVHLTLMSRVIDEVDTDSLGLETTVRNAFELDESDETGEVTTSHQQTGGLWDVAVAGFITGVFLDNIRPVLARDGYRASYQHRVEALQDDILFHHSLGLTDGQYIIRTDNLNVKMSHSAEFYLRDEQTVCNELHDKHEHRDT
jgi:hypothetical protein